MKYCLIIFIIFFTSYTSSAENVSNYGNCKVCAGGIHYSSNDVREILGEKGFALVSRLGIFSGKKIRIDLDGALQPGSKDDNDMRYELEIFGSQNNLVVKDIRDESYIQLVTDYSAARTADNLNKWNPEIYVFSSVWDEINLSDPPPTAWKKVKKSNIHQWIISGGASGGDERTWKLSLRKRLLYVLKLMDNKK